MWGDRYRHPLVVSCDNKPFVEKNWHYNGFCFAFFDSKLEKVEEKRREI